MSRRRSSSTTKGPAEQLLLLTLAFALLEDSSLFSVSTTRARFPGSIALAKESQSLRDHLRGHMQAGTTKLRP